MDSSQRLTELDKEIMKKAKAETAEKGLVICCVLAIHTYELHEEVQRFMRENPNASFLEIERYTISLCPPLEIEEG